MDPAIRWEVVRGRLPISIQLDQSEIASTTTPTPFFTLSPRVSYLPQILPGLHRHFETYCVPSYGRSLDPWMEYNGIPLDWRIPLGVLFDTLSSSSPILPWKLVIHFNSIPKLVNNTITPQSHDNDIHRFSIRYLTLPTWLEFQQHHSSLIKQSLYIFHGHGKAFGCLNNEIQTKLFDAIRRVDQPSFDNIWFGSLLGSDLTCLKKVPIRVYLHGHGGNGRLASYQTRNSKLHLNSLTTIHDWLTEFLPNDVPVETLEVIIQGVQLTKLSISLMWVALVSSYLDGFLHLVLRPRSNFKFSKSFSNIPQQQGPCSLKYLSAQSQYDSTNTSVMYPSPFLSPSSWCSTTCSEADASICVAAPIRKIRTLHHPILKSHQYIETRFRELPPSYHKKSLCSDFFNSSLDIDVIVRLRAWKDRIIHRRFRPQTTQVELFDHFR